MKILRTDDVLERLGISRTTLWEMRRRGDFPEARQIGARAIGWREEDIERWWQERPVAQPEAGGSHG